MGPSQRRRPEEDAVRAFLADALSGEQPKSGVWDFASKRVPRRRPLRLWLAASVVAAMLLMLRLPIGIRALASCPIVGGAFSRCVQAFAKDLAFQAGLTQELNRTQVVDGIRITVVGARSEEDGTTVFYTLSPEPGQESDVWRRIRDGTILVDHVLLPREELNSAPNPSSYWCFNREEDVVYGIARGAPISMYQSIAGGNVTLAVEAREALSLSRLSFGTAASALGQAVTEWIVRVPTQSIPASEERVAVGKTVPGTDERLTVAALDFSPLGVVLRYEVSPGSGESLPWSLLGECFALVTADGREIPCFGHNDPQEARDNLSGHGEVYFLPTARRDLSVVFRPLKMEPASPSHLVQWDELTLRDGGVTMVAGVRRADGSVQLALGSSLPAEAHRILVFPSYVLDPAGASSFEVRR